MGGNERKKERERVVVGNIHRSYAEQVLLAGLSAGGAAAALSKWWLCERQEQLENKMCSSDGD